MHITRILACAIAITLGCSSSGEHVSESDEAVDSICGEKVSASIDGIPAYAYCGDTNVWSDNGVDTMKSSGGTGWVQTEHGYGYQCVEFAVRYMRFKWNVSTSWGVSYAKQMCANHPSGVSVTTKPVHGDLVVFDGGSCGADPTAGHVAVVDSIGSTTFVAVQENTAGKYTYKNSCASCFLHAASNVPVVDAGSDASADAAIDASESDSSSDAPPPPEPSADAAPTPPPPPDAGDVAPSVGGCSSAPRAPSSGWVVVALGLVVTALRRRGSR